MEKRALQYLEVFEVTYLRAIWNADLNHPILYYQWKMILNIPAVSMELQHWYCDYSNTLSFVWLGIREWMKVKMDK